MNNTPQPSNHFSLSAPRDASWRFLIKMGLALALTLASSSVFAKKEKILVCHVGNQLGSDGATYLENPDCTPPDGYTVDDYVCPDAGKTHSGKLTEFFTLPFSR